MLCEFLNHIEGDVNLFCSSVEDCQLTESNLAGVVSPVEQSLALFASAAEIAGMAIFLDLSNVAAHGFPTFDLPQVFFWSAATPVITAIPLKPTSRVLWVDPAFFLPIFKGHGGIDFEKIKIGVFSGGREFGVGEPFGGQFFGSIAHVFSTKYAQF